MRTLISIILLIFSCLPVSGQNAEKIYETERVFEKIVAEQGMRAGFLEFLTADGVMFFPEAANGRETWKARPASPAALTWNPILIDISSNGVLAYSIGNSVYRPKGKGDPAGLSGHYISIWTRQPDGQYRAVLDTGINHDAPSSTPPTDWKSPSGPGEKNERRLSAADSSTGFYLMAETSGVANAFKAYLAEDTTVMRDGFTPFFGKRAAVDFLRKQRGVFKFAKRKLFVEAADLAYVHGPYSIADNSGKESERGNFVQVWKMRNGRWQIVADVLIAVTKAAK